MNELSHTDNTGKANMVDVTLKPDCLRTAKAVGSICIGQTTLQLVSDNQIKKGDVLTLAEISGIQAAKKTSELIPLCHPLQITKISVEAKLAEDRIIVSSEVKCIGQTGVEMEALTAVSVALLSIYDMCKAVDKSMIIGEIRLIEKTRTDIIRS